MKIFIACSKHFYNKIPSIKEVLEQRGHILAMPNSYDQPMREEEMKLLSPEEHIGWKGEMLRKDKENIEPNDAVLILNYEKKGQPNYIGGATFLEMFRAWEMGKKIYLLNPIPENLLKDEIIGFNPVILNGDLSKIENISEEKSIVNSKAFSSIAKESTKIADEIGLNIDDKLNKFTQEIGELNDAIQKYRGRFCRQKADNLNHVEEEIGDVIFNLISICDALNINPDKLNDYALDTLKKFRERKEIYKEAIK